MPRGRGKRGQHKGGRRHFTSEQELQANAAREAKDKEWREKKGIASDTDEEEDEEKKKEKAAKKDEDGIGFESSSEESSSEEEEEGKAKGVQHLIDVANPNRIVKKTKKVTQLDEAAKPQLSRREKEELEKQRAKENYQKMHAAGKTDEARADLARLAIIRQQREDAAKKKDAEKKEKDSVKAAAEQKLKDRRAQAK